MLRLTALSVPSVNPSEVRLWIRFAVRAGDNIKLMTGNTALTSNLIQSLDSDGFTLER